jgi:hypothetical protein
MRPWKEVFRTVDVWDATEGLPTSVSEMNPNYRLIAFRGLCQHGHDLVRAPASLRPRVFAYALPVMPHYPSLVPATSRSGRYPAQR